MNGNNDFTMACGTFVQVSGATDGSITLADLSVTGYTPCWYDEDDAEDFVGGCRGAEFRLRLLLPSGYAEAEYYWLDTVCEEPYNPDGIAPGWYADKNGTPIEDGADSVTITAGRGLWISGQAYTLNIPAPKLK